MKKILGMVICFCILLENVSMALTTDAFSINLPSDFTMKYQDGSSGEYTNEKIKISYSIQKNNKFGIYKDPKEIKEDYINGFDAYTLSSLGFEKDSELVRINNKNFLKYISKIKGNELSPSELLVMYMKNNQENNGENVLYYDELNEKAYKDIITISYLGTTANKMTIIKFTGENLDETEVERIMSTIKLKGLSSNIYIVGIKILIYSAGVSLFIILLIVLNSKKKAKEKQTKTHNTFETQQYQNSDNKYNTLTSHQDQNSNNELVSHVKNK